MSDQAHIPLVEGRTGMIYSPAGVYFGVIGEVKPQVLVDYGIDYPYYPSRAGSRRVDGVGSVEWLKYKICLQGTPTLLTSWESRVPGTR